MRCRCAACTGQDLETRDCWSSGPRSRECANDPRSGDYLSCPFTGHFDGKEVCFAKPPDGYCVKKVCAKHGSSKSCRSYDPPASGQFCVGDADAEVPIDHVVIRYTCCNPNLLTFAGSCGFGSNSRRLQGADGSQIANLIAKFEVMAGARNRAGSSWGLPVPLACGPISLSSQINRGKFEIPEKCSKLLPGESCEVGCSSDYILQRKPDQGTFTCQWGMSRPLAGTFPECLRKPSGLNLAEGKAQAATTTTTTLIPPLCEVCSEIGNYADKRFEQCRFWGDPHITKSWRPKTRFNFQDTGIHRYARAGQCAGNFELHVFQCQYNRGRNAVATGIAARLNGNGTIFISDRRVETSGRVFATRNQGEFGLNVEPDSGTILNDRAGVNVQSPGPQNLMPDCQIAELLRCFQLVYRLAHEGVVKAHHQATRPADARTVVATVDITADGICGAADLKSQQLSGAASVLGQATLVWTAFCLLFLFKPLIASPCCEFLAPLEGLDQVCTTENDGRVAQLEDNGQNCVVYAVLDSRRSCNDYCQERGSVCVATKSDRGPCVFDGQFKNQPCSKKMHDVMCVCRKPENTNPGTDAIQACVGSDVTLEGAEDLCRANGFLQNAVFPPRYTEEGAVTTDEQDEVDDMLKDCMIDACSGGAEDAALLADNLATENPQIVARACAFTEGKQFEVGFGAYPCNCQGVECQTGEVCTIIGNASSCGPLTTTNTVTSLTATSTATSTSSSATTQTASSTTRSVTRSSTTTQTTTSMSISSTSRTSSISSTTSLTETSSTRTSTASTTSNTATVTDTSTTTFSSSGTTTSVSGSSTTRSSTSESATSTSSATSTFTTVTVTITSFTSTQSETTRTATSSTVTTATMTLTTSTTVSTSSTMSTSSSTLTKTSSSTVSSSTTSSSSSSTTASSTTSTSASSSSTTSLSETSTFTTTSSTWTSSTTSLSTSSTSSTSSSSSLTSSTTASTSTTSSTSSTTSVTSTSSSRTSSTTQTITTTVSTSVTSTSLTLSTTSETVTSTTLTQTSTTSTVSSSSTMTTTTSSSGTSSTSATATSTSTTSSTITSSTTTSTSRTSTSRTSTSSTRTTMTQTLTGTSSTVTSSSITATTSTVSTSLSSSSSSSTATASTSSSTSTSTTATVTSKTVTTSSTTGTTLTATSTVSTTSASSTTSTSRTKTSYTTSTTTTFTTTTTYFTTLMCGPWNPSGGGVLLEWDGGDLSQDLLDDGNGWEWRVDMRKQGEGNEWFFVSHCADIATTSCEVWCLEPGAMYDVRVQLASTIPELVIYDIFVTVVMVPNIRAGMPEDLTVVQPTSSSLHIAWNASSEQGNCTFRAWQIEMRDPNGGWTKDPPACTSLTSFETASCVITNLPCQSPHIIQVRQLCWNEESTSEWSRPISGSTLVTIGPNCLQAATLPSNLALTSPGDDQLNLTWTAGLQEDSQFISWNVELYKTKFVGGQPDPEAEEQIDACQGLLDRTTTTCSVSGLTWGMYRFAVQEVSSLPATSSPLSAASEAAWVARIPAVAPTGLILTEATETSLRVSWTRSLLKDCPFQRLLVELSNGTDFIEPASCNSITDSATTSCVATGLQSWTTYTARASVLCDECSGTPTDQRVPCSEEDTPATRCLVPATGGLSPCFRKLPAFRASSSYSSPSLPASTLPRLEATPVLGAVQVPADSGQRVRFEWVAGVGSRGNVNVTSDCIFQSWRLEILVESESVWGLPEGCLSLIDPGATTCTAINLQCDTTYHARLRVLCTMPAASSDWMTFPAFRTAYAGNCLKTASPPLLIRNTSRTATSITVAFIAGSPGDCIFDRFELQYQEMNSTSWISVPADCGSLDVRLGPSCIITGLAQDTGYNFRAREICSNGAPLASTWGLTEGEEPMYTGLVPAVQSPSYLEPEGFLSPSEPPSRLLLIFEEDLQLGDPSAMLSLCPMLLPSATSDDPGICNCGTSEDCAGQCLTQATMDVELLSSRVLLARFGSLLRPLTGCPYLVLLEAGFLQTQLAPSNPSPRIEWSFIYWPPAPTGSLTLFSSTTTSLTVRVSWSIPMTTTCGVLVGFSTMHQTDPLDFTGSREFLEVRINGLYPFTQYTVVCTGSAIGDPVVTASVSESAFSTEPDTNNRLSNIIVDVQALCTTRTTSVDNSTNVSANVSQVQVSMEAAFLPVFDPSLRRYQLILDAEYVRDLCGASEIEALFRIEVSAMTQSAFASASIDHPVQILAQPLPDSMGFLPPEVPRSHVSQVRLTVHPPQPGQSPPQDYILDIVVGVLDVRLESTNIPTMLAADASSSADFVISTPRGMEAAILGLRIGPFTQLLTAINSENYTENLLERTRHNLTAANIVGLGSGLTITVQVRPPPGSNFPTLDVRTVFVVSFEPPTVVSIETDMVNNTISIVQTTVITVSGTNLLVPAQFTTEPVSAEIFIAGIPANCTTSECQEPALQALLDAGQESLCSDLVAISAGTLSCSIEPTVDALLGLCLVLRGGFLASRYCAAFGPPGSLRPEQPTVGGLTQPVQDMSSSEPFLVLVDGDLPWANVSQGYLQVWATVLTEVAADVSNPGVGYQPLCSQAVRTANNTIQCFRNQNFNISQLGAQSNIYVQSGPNATSTNIVEGALQINQPRILQITRSHEFEVGALDVTIEGQHFGTQANGNMVVQLETFGANTQAVPDLSLAEDLGQPTHIVPCQVISHQDTEVRCRVEDQNLFGAAVSGEYYNETVEVDEGRRLQEGESLDLERLALQLSQLPVGFSVFYELDCSILERLNQTCNRPQNLSALSREWQAVRLKPCPAGERRSSFSGTGCVQCVPGTYKSGVGPALSCNECGIGFYMGLPGAGACTACPVHETTNVTGATSISSCDCMPGYFRTNIRADWELALSHGVCRACPDGAICEGGPIQPYSAHGYWTPDRLVFWPCFPSHACLKGDAVDPNLCEDARDPSSIRCGRCHTDAFAHQSECYSCGGLDVALAWMGPFLGLLALVFGFLPALVRSLRSMDMEHTALQQRLLHTGQSSSWLGRLAESDHGEFRMVIVMLTSLQTLWTVSLMPLPYTRFTKDWLWTVGIAACDVSILRPQCAFKLSYFMKWLMQWATFFVVVAVLTVSMMVYCVHHKNRLRDIGYISPRRGILGVVSVTLMLLLLVHLRDDMIFLNCIPCEGDKFCLSFQPVIECATTNWEWTTMMVLSVLDLLFVIVASVPFVAMTIYTSWKWQHGQRRGLDSAFAAPWYVYFSEFWVKRHRGYIQEVRQAVPEFQKLFLSEDNVATSHKEIWQRAIDLILAQEAEKADMLLLRVIEHMYTHSDRFKAVDEDEGPAYQIIRGIRNAIRRRRTDHSEGLTSSGGGYSSEATVNRQVPPETEPGEPQATGPSGSLHLSEAVTAASGRFSSEEAPVPPETEPVVAAVTDDRLYPMEEPPQLQEPPPDSDPPDPKLETLKVSDVHHVKLTLENLLDYAKWSVPGARAIKRVLSYCWTLILLVARFVITAYAMLMPRDQSNVPLLYLLVTLAYVILGAGLQPYVWNFLNDWEVAVHSLIYVFLLFVISGWSDTASDVLVVVATMTAIVPVILRFFVVLCGQEKQDPEEDAVSKSQGAATYDLERLGRSMQSQGSVSRATSAVSSRPTTRTRSIQDGRHREHIRNYIDMVKQQNIGIVQSTVDEQGREVALTRSMEAPAQPSGGDTHQMTPDDAEGPSGPSRQSDPEQEPINSFNI
ncbi:sapA [Symbiodinium natans]|uniref:SapA protein n=1 Tax=Symbiodinium natans TaxID=878477 RepID=A0A812RIH8_9DINO|nr:sapA [Symbiodinium natans]